ncbi:MAG: hypothetical protein JXB00_12545 [Bacteroidales bacterium]|nr:hypothetical protein [Bacteroidales bacterium]
MKLNFLRGQVFIMLVLTMLACNKDETAGPETAKTTLLTTETVDASGGIIEAEGIIIDIPAGTFDVEREISVYTKEILDGHPYKDGAVSGLYEVDGIPKNFALPITIKLKCTNVSESCHLAVGTVYPIVNEDTTIMSFYLIEEAETEGDYVSALFQPDTSESSGLKSSKLEQGLNEELHDFIVSITMDKYKSTYFEIDYPVSVSKTDIERLGTYLDNAVYKAKDMGFPPSYARLYKPHIEIMNMAGLKVVCDGYDFMAERVLYQPIAPLTLDPYIGDYCWYNDLKGICISELLNYHTLIEQAAYRLVFGSSMTWLESVSGSENVKCASAFIGWAQRLIGENQDFEAPLAFEESIYYPMMGYFSTHFKCGYMKPGFSAYLAYFDKNYQHEEGHIIKMIYDELTAISNMSQEQRTLFNAITYVTQLKTWEWYPDFINHYISGKVYTVDDEKFLSYVYKTYKLDNSLNESFNASIYAAYETKLFKFDLSGTNISEKSVLQAIPDIFYYPANGYAGNIYFNAFTYGAGEGFKHIQSGNGSIHVAGLDKIGAGKSIILGVTYCPENEKENMFDLDFKVYEGEGVYTHGLISTQVGITAHYLDGTEGCDGTKEFITTIDVEFTVTEINGATVKAVWDNISGDQGTKGKLEIYFQDANLDVLTGFDVKEYLRYDGTSQFGQKSTSASFNLSSAHLAKNPGDVEGTDRFWQNGCAGLDIVDYTKSNYFAFGCQLLEMISWDCITDLDLKNTYVDIQLSKK